MKKLCRIIFSRYAISALIILFDIALLTLLAVYSITSYIWVAVISSVIDLLVVLSLVNRDTNPEFKISWLVIVLVLPVFGALLYLLFYQSRLSPGDVKRMKAILSELDKSAERSEENAECLNALSELSPSAAGRAYSLLGLDPFSRLCRRTSLKYFPSGEEMFTAMLEDIKSAERFIFLEYFIICEGVMWDTLTESLAEAAARGVDVRVLFDDIGSLGTLPIDCEARLAARGITARRFAKVSPRVTSLHNNRDHRKFTIIDAKIAYTGGINIADEYINRAERFGHWKDGGVRVLGDAAIGFAVQFLSLYDLSARRMSDYSALLPQELPSGSPCDISTVISTGQLPQNVLCAEEGDGGYYIPFGSGPSPIYSRSVGKSVLMEQINRAEKYLYLTTPYLVIDYDLTEALRSAAARGVDVRIITPGIPDKKIVKIITKSSYLRLIESGVRIFEYSIGFMHEKLLISDDSSAVIGTINLDYRSLVHHFEDALWIYGSPELPRIRESFMQTLAKSVEIDRQGAKLGPIESVIKYIVKIFSPLL